MANTFSIGGTANIRAIDATNFAVAMTGVFDGGVYDRTTAATDAPDGKKHYNLRHYFVADDGSYVYTQDKSVHTPVEGTIYFAQTEYTVVEASGRFKGMTGAFRSWGAINYSKGVGVLRFERQLHRSSDVRLCQVITSRYSSLSEVEGSGRQLVSTPLNELKIVNLFFDND